jgi:hypothetical protein
VFVQELFVYSGDSLFRVENGGEVEGDSDMNVSGGGYVLSDVFKE